MNTNPHQSRTPASTGAAWLWASALVLAGLIVVQLARPATGTSPRDPGAVFALAAGLPGDVVTRVGDFSLLTFDAGSDDVLVVLDGRDEQILVYGIEQQNKLVLLDREALPAIFNTARQMGPSRR
jgi:hypothetical protein